MTKARTLADNFAADINGITAGTGITGGGTSGTVTVTNSMATAIDAKGDLVVGTGADTFSRLAVASTAGYLLSVDSAETTGLKWVAPASGSMTLLSTTSLTGSSITFSSISQDYVDLRLELTDVTFSTNASEIRVRFNGDTGSNYQGFHFFSHVGTVDIFSTFTGTSLNPTSAYGMQNTSVDAVFMYDFFDYKNTTSIRCLSGQSSYQKPSSTAGDRILNATTGFYNNVGTTISSISVAISAGTFSTGTAKLYGVN